MKVLESRETRELEKKAVESGVGYPELMENAGRAAADFLKGRADGKNVAILCGKGNNGGDGYVAARILSERGAKVCVVLTQGAPATDLARDMFSRMDDRKVHTLDWSREPEEVRTVLFSADFVLDAIYGIGFHGSMPQELFPLLDAAERSGAFVLSLDLPSGALCDTGEIEGRCVRADATVTFSTLKPAHLIQPAKEFCGEVHAVPVGIPEELIRETPSPFEAVGPETVRSLFAPRAQNTNKGTYGTLLALCGSPGMAGAAVLSAAAALRCGAGLVNVALPKEIYPVAASYLPEPVYTLLETGRDGALTARSRKKLGDALLKATACLVGCGLGAGMEERALVRRLTGAVSVPLIVDADGINILARNIDILKTARVPVVLTPHPGEMARLIHSDARSVQSYRLRCARDFAREHGVVLVLKGSGTIVAAPDGRVFLNPTGNPGMAKGGSGDVLAGMIASFAAQGIDPVLAAVCGVYLHGLAGDRCAKRFSQRAMLPSDLVRELPALFSESEQ
ncbi:ADP-dependent (S)-NAD(P)H-hydrate dehydratase,NAD(P)H-hydrate epimerase [Ruminococcaceae bacterium BL-6]|nr:ADP-dependent (S)-NAD(P)H-hydrate dehydratase,NAD(P)H-hydrate epimerase [Ruminococcaceae bacterium BL-6]